MNKKAQKYVDLFADKEQHTFNKENYKTKMCKHWDKNETCPYGLKCEFAHGNKELNSHLYPDPQDQEIFIEQKVI